MSLGIAFKGPEGIVLAADSRVTLLYRPGGANEIMPATFDNATKLLHVPTCKRVGAITYGLGALGTNAPRTAHSFLPELEAELENDHSADMPVEEFATRLSRFFVRQWSEQGMPDPGSFEGDPMVFLVGGYNEGEPYGRVYEFFLPTRPEPRELNPSGFGMTWGGQHEITSRMMHGYDANLPRALASELELTSDQQARLPKVLERLNLKVPYQFLPLQDCVDLSILLVRTTIELQAFQVGIRGVGGAIDVATITRTDGFKAVQQKVLRGERSQ